MMVWKPISITKEKQEDLNFGDHFKPKRHYFYEKCCKCGRKLKHYHWFWGEGDKMYCDVDYDGNTEWNCQECEDKREVLHKLPTEGGEG